MNKTQKDFLSLLRNSIACENTSVDNIDYDEVGKIALNQVCLPLVCDGAVRASLEPPEKWKQHSLYVAASNYKNLSVQSKIISILQKNNIKCAVLKGITVAKCYPEPIYRPLGDIDILVELDRYDDAINILTGTPERDAEHNKHKFHYLFLYDGVDVEIHKAVTKYPDSKYGDMLHKYLDKALETTEIGKYDCFSFPMLEPRFQIISLVLHTQRHFAAQKTTMRMICDFAMAVRNVESKVWNEEVYPVLVDLKMEKFVGALMTICSEYLGVDFEERSVQNIDNDTANEFMAELWLDGIAPKFGKNSQMSKKNMLAGVMLTVKEMVLRDFPIVEKFPLLFPIFYAYVPLRSMYRKIKGKRRNITVTGYGVSYRQRSDLCKKLNIK